MEPVTLITNVGPGFTGRPSGFHNGDLSLQSSSNAFKVSVIIERSNTPSSPRDIVFPFHPCRKPKKDVNSRDNAGADCGFVMLRPAGGRGDATGDGTICTSMAPIRIA